ncbi:polyphosphate polymerase domain-containing protein [Pseudoalteromonas sp. MMG010]|uniref:polyphosphate polymerase domain-containing protein n=1 Tax=Pseudoalteromonas sp. MMG010 TaxID=2822685 RepID=UPI001B3A0193|nr:polyphosphate polymerase domain-containing protein [Pseudoalteromonas sp. MMG010]MBQ4833561.1 polyphosphate polymerase domain-containing protein [Pseudoalteromonas sp. MMG010]
MAIQMRVQDESYEMDVVPLSPKRQVQSGDIPAKKIVQPSPITIQSNLYEVVNTLLMPFEGYGLNDLNNANLMNRVDSKFMLPLSFLPELLKHLEGQYRVLDIKGKRFFSYYNQYFDTPDLNLYRAHHNGKLNRYKVRRRCYVDTQTEFLEVKLKNNQKRTVKTRIKLADTANKEARCTAFIKQEMKHSYDHLTITQQSGYNRIALANEEKAERLTLDFNLWYNTPEGDNKVSLPGFFIAELKQSKKSKNSPFYQLMSKHHVFPVSFSKYCIGCALLYLTSIKANRFKSVLSRIKKLHLNNPLSPIENF